MGKGMKAGKKPKSRPAGGGNFGGGNMQKQLAQAQAMQREMEKMQAELEEKEFTATAGGGAISVTASGAKEIKALEIDKDVVDPDDVEMLQDLIIAAVNEVMRQIDEASESEMSKLTGGLNIPGLM